MKKIGGILFLSVSAYLLAGCTANTTPAGNTTANSAANSSATNSAAKPAAAAPSVDALLALDKQATDAWTKGDADFFKGFLSDKAVGFEGGQPAGKDAIVKMIAGAKCDIKSSSLEEPKVVNIDADNYVLTYKGTFDGTCTDPSSSKSMKVPSPVRAATLYTRSGDKWQGVWHGEVPITAPEKAADETKKADTEKKPDAAKESKPEAKSADTAAGVPPRSANTDALTKNLQAGWEAFKNKDAKWFEANTTSNLTFIDAFGALFPTQAETIKSWTTMDCKDITKVGVKNGYAVSLSPTLELLNATGYADGTCNGMKNGDLQNFTIYQKDGDAWKLAFMLETLPQG